MSAAALDAAALEAAALVNVRELRQLEIDTEWNLLEEEESDEEELHDASSEPDSPAEQPR